MSIELLAPAQNLSIGLAAIHAGADAVYIGAPRFSARSAAGTSLEDIETLVREAHIYHARVYLALNTILRDDELEEAQNLIHQAWKIGIDAVIFQDMGILEMDLPPIPLHASTQCDNRVPENINFLSNIGVRRIILARELTLSEIKAIQKENPTIELEFFVHGALCVSFSGRCYLSYATTRRSANRGECAQPCRMYYNLEDSQGKILAHKKHLLSLKDLNLSLSLEELIDAGITSLKIEGRLKGEDYVKNIVSYYRKKLDRILEQKKLSRSSDGKSLFSITPNPSKSFSRGFTSYFLHDKKNRVASIHTQKSTGEKIGIVASLNQHQHSFQLETAHDLHNQDGICFFDNQKTLHGTKILKVENHTVFVQDARRIKQGSTIYRNHDHKFKKEIKTQKPHRILNLNITFTVHSDSIQITLQDETGIQITEIFENLFETARNSETALKSIKKQFSKLGNTPFGLKNFITSETHVPFIPVSTINEMRRFCVQKLIEARIHSHSRETCTICKNNAPYPLNHLTYENNVSNRLVHKFYKQHGVQTIEPAAELGTDLTNRKLMTTRHCILNELQYCKAKQKNTLPFSEPLFLVGKEQKFRLSFNCKRCKMTVWHS